MALLLGFIYSPGFGDILRGVHQDGILVVPTTTHQQISGMSRE